MTLRIPVPPGARGLAQRILDHFEPRLRRRPPLALRNPRRTYWICGILLAAAAMAGPAGYALAEAAPDGMNPLVPLTLVIGAVICAVFAVLLAFATFLLTRGK